MELLGRGSYFEIYTVQNDGGVRALKRPKPSLKDDPNVRRMLQTEAKVLQALEGNPRFPKIFQVGEDSSGPFILMERLRGNNLQQVIEQNKKCNTPFTPLEAASIALQIAEGLSSLHGLSLSDGPVIHADLKPHNIMLELEGDIKIIDLTLEGGTFAYMPPERMDSRKIEISGDLFAFGLILYELLTNEVLIPDSTKMEMYFKMRDLRRSIPSFPNFIPEPLSDIIRKSLNAGREGGYSSASSIARDLNSYLIGHSPTGIINKPTLSMPPSISKPIKKIREFGKVMRANEQGYLTNECSWRHIPSEWRPLIDEVRGVYLRHLGANLHSVYIRGSVVMGTAHAGESDLDSFAVVHRAPDPSDLQWMEEYGERFRLSFPLCRYVEIRVLPLQELLNSLEYLSWRFTLKILSLCIQGEDLSAQLPNFRPSRANGFFLFGNIYEILDTASRRLRSTRDADEIEKICSWVMKKILRTGFSLVMEKEQVFTRDLYPSYELFSKHYPEKKPEMRQALEWAVNPTADKEALGQYLGEFGGWLGREFGKK
ncbi:MAG TPA: serine/threonine-protein kinase [bacterium]|nr:serine/threonine-protein kinase [bacterium]